MTAGIRLEFADVELERKYRFASDQECTIYLRRLLWVGFVAIFLFAWQDSSLDPVSGANATSTRFFLVLPVCALLITVTKFPKLNQWVNVYGPIGLGVFFGGVVWILFFLEGSSLGLSSASGTGNIVVTLLAIVALTGLRTWASIATGLIALAVYLYAGLKVARGSTVDFLQGEFASIVLVFCIGVTVAFLNEMRSRREFEKAELLEIERRKHADLLFRLVPQQIAERIISKEFPIADSLAEVSIIFADIVDFSSLSREVPPREMVRYLNELFSAFDRAAESEQVETIKTTGDGYLAICGPPVQEDERSIRAINFASKILHKFSEISGRYEFRNGLRIGVHTGPIVAGVIGRHRFVYDVWGNTVNVASRIEQSCDANEIFVSEGVYRRARHHFHFFEIGTVHPKGVDPVKIYALRPRPNEGGSPNVGPRAAE